MLVLRQTIVFAACCLSIVMGASLLTTTGCAGTTVGAPFRRAEMAASEAHDCPPSQIHEVAGQEWTEGSFYVVQACGQRYTYECDEATCEPACEYTPVPSNYDGEGEDSGGMHEMAMARAAHEFDCQDDLKQIRRSGSTYVLHVCGQEVRYDCSGDGCRLKCD